MNIVKEFTFKHYKSLAFENYKSVFGIFCWLDLFRGERGRGRFLLFFIVSDNGDCQLPGTFFGMIGYEHSPLIILRYIRAIEI